jgi:hypothetical protein
VGAHGSDEAEGRWGLIEAQPRLLPLVNAGRDTYLIVSKGTVTAVVIARGDFWLT